MSDNIDIPIEAGSPDPINRLTSAIDRLYGSLEKLGTAQFSSPLQKQMAEMQQATLSSMQIMQASITTGFREMAALSAKGAAASATATAEAVKVGAEKTIDAMAKAAQKMKEADARTWEQIQRGSAANVTKAFNQLAQGIPVEMVQKRYGEMATSAAASMDGQLAKLRQFQANSKSLWETHYRAMAGATEAEISLAHKMNAARDQALRLKSAGKVDARTLLGLPSDEEARAAGRRIAAQMQEGAREAQRMSDLAERQRRLNTTFAVASPGSQLRTAREAQVYAGLGGDAAARYGSAAATANIRELEAAYAKLHPAVRHSAESMRGHNDLMREGHSLARGLAGSLGGLWLTYGSLVPLLAGAAIAASLKGIVEAGKEVEAQLNFVTALTKEDVSLDRFLTITDSSLRSVKESAEAMRMLAQNGLNANQSLRALPAILDLATIGEMNVGQAALAATGATAAFGLQMGEASRVADIFAITAANSNTSVLAMTESMKQASTVSSLFKVSIEETAGMLGLLAKINVTGGAAGTSMTNMLTGLYEPTEKGKRALKELGVETHLASGALKPLTQLLEDLQTALAGFNDSARVDLLGSIFTVRGVKSAELALSNIDEFKKKTEEARGAAGFMFEAVRQLEDSTAGVFDRLGVTVQNTFVKSFAEASPYVQRLGLDLNHAFKSEGTQNALANLATNVARLSLALVENADVIGTAVAGYAAWTLLGPRLITVITAAQAASAALATAQGAAAAASVAFNTAQAAGTATTAMYTAAIEAQAAASTAATAASAAWGATVLPILGAVAIAAAALGAAWLLLRDNTDDADRANLKMANTLDVVGEALEKEIERLERVNDLWDARNNKFLDGDSERYTTVQQARMNVLDIETQILAAGGDPAAARRQTWQDRGGRQVLVDTHPLGAALRQADENLAKAQRQVDTFDTKADPGRNAEKVLQAASQLQADIQKVSAMATARTSKGDVYAPDIQALARKAGELLHDVTTITEGVSTIDGLSKPKADFLLSRAEEVRADLKMTQDKINSLQHGRAPKPDTTEDNAAYRAQREGYDAALAVARKDAETSKRDIESLYKAGEISAIEAARRVHDVEVALQEAAIQSAKDKGDLARDYDKKTDATKAEKDAAVARAGIREADAKHERAHLDMVANWKASATQYAIEQARKEGNTALAYKLQHAAELAQVDRGLKDSEALLAEALATGDQKRIDKALAAIAALKEVKRHSDAAVQAAENVDAVHKAAKEFQSAFTGVRVQVEDLVQKSSGGAGLSAIFGNALEAAKLYDAEIGTLAAKQAALQEAADKSGLPEDQTKANNALREMQRLGAQVRNVWVGVGHAIEQSLSSAFGKAGAAVGRLANISVQYAVKEKQVFADLEKFKGQPEYEARRKAAIGELQSAEVAAYAHMAGAAKNYFDEGTKGYQALESVEKAFRAVELAMTIKNMLVKSGLTKAFTGLFVAGKQQEVAAEVASVGPTVAAQVAKGQAAAAVGVANQAGGDVYTAWPRMAAMAAVMAALGFAVASTGRGDTTTIDRQAAQGTGSVLGDPKAKSESIAKALEHIEKSTFEGVSVSMDMLTTLRGIHNSLGGLGNLLIRNSGVTGDLPDVVKGSATRFTEGLGSKLTLTSLLDSVTGGFFGRISGKISNAVFGGNRTALDGGITANRATLGGVMAGGLTASRYTDMHKEGGWFHSDKTWTDTKPLGTEADQQFTRIILDMSKGITQAATALGLGGDAFTQRLNRFVVDIGKISLTGLKPDEIQAQIEAVFSKVGDDMAKFAVGDLLKFAQGGEGAFETLMRVATNYQAVDTVMQSVGRTFGQVGLASVEARERLIEVSGGLDDFLSQGSFFLRNFFSESEQASALKAQLQPTLAKFGLSADGPGAMKLFRDYAMSLDLTTESGAQAYATLMRVAPALKSVADMAKEVADEAADLQDQLDQLLLKPSEYAAKKAAAERAALDPANRALFDQVQAAKAVAEARDRLVEAYREEKQEMEANIDRLKSLADGWREFRDGLLLGDKSPLTPQQKYLEAKSQYETTLALAQSGDVKAQGEYQTVAEKFLEASRLVNTSSPAYARDFERVRAATEAAIAWAEAQVTIEQASLTALERQVGSLANIEESTSTVATEIARLTELLGQGPIDAANRSAVQGLYQGLLGREGEAAGVDFWANALKSGGASLGDVARAFTSSAEYMARANPQGFTATQGAYQAFNSASDLSAMTAYLRQMLEAMEALRREQEQQTQDQIDAAFAASQAAAETMAAATAEAAEATVWASRSKPELV